MRLCLISHAYLESAYGPVLEALAVRPDVELALVTPKQYKLNLQTSSGEFSGESAQFVTYALPIHFAGRQGTFVYAGKQLRAALDEFKPDLILHEQEVYALGAGQIAAVARSRRIPVVMFVWENVQRSFSAPRRWLRSYVLRRSAGVIAGSERAAAMHKAWGFHGAIAVLPQMGTAVGSPPTLGRRQPGGLQICYVGRLIAAKGIDVLLRAVARLQSHGILMRCTIAGRGEERERLEQLAEQLGICSVVSFAGVLVPEETKALIRRSDVLVLPSRRVKDWEEQFGRVLIEAMAEGTVPIGTNTGAIREVIGSEALLFAQDDVDGLAELLERFAKDETFLCAQQEAAWARFCQRYTHEVVTEEKVAFLKHVLQTQPKS